MITEHEIKSMKLPPFRHQVEGADFLMRLPFAGLFDKMGLGKTKQTLDAAQALFIRGIINRLVIICPVPVRSVWFDAELGEIRKHLWDGMHVMVTEFHAKRRRWIFGPRENPQFRIIITNYEFIGRSKQRKEQLKAVCDKRTFLVLDEGSAVKNHRAEQTKACLEIRRKCGRVVILNGTPISHSPLDLFSQSNILSPTILGHASYYKFRAQYAVMGGYMQKQIVEWKNLDDLQRRMAPYVLSRKKEDCLDLPEKFPAVNLPVTLSSETWSRYVEMRDEMVLWLEDQNKGSIANQAITKAMRLAQIVCGFIGGVHALDDETEPPSIVEIGREKLDAFLEWYTMKLEEDPTMKMIVWSRFRPECFRLYDHLPSGVPKGLLLGGQKRVDREHTLRLLDPRTAPEGPAVVVGTPSTGSMGLNLTAASVSFYLSNDYSLKTRLQSEDRTHRPGQVKPCYYFDSIATGPKGQRTIDHIILKSRISKNDLANMTISAWLRELKNDVDVDVPMEIE